MSQEFVWYSVKHNQINIVDITWHRCMLFLWSHDKNIEYLGEL